MSQPEERPSTAAERSAARAEMAAQMIGMESDRMGPKWYRRWRRRNAERQWLTALNSVTARDRDED